MKRIPATIGITARQFASAAWAQPKQAIARVQLVKDLDQRGFIKSPY